MNKNNAAVLDANNKDKSKKYNVEVFRDSGLGLGLGLTIYTKKSANHLASLYYLVI